ncbi:hypothetical protein [Citrobacter koseri]|uniref:hypothetical protein n=1 Tax=Citrobacter koseri TaxID=545 RepID=UPI0007355865|nr:hypothetical protein [Citrobacter koseri]
MSKPSSTAGKACVECGIPDPCLMDVITDFPENEEHHVWSKEGIVHFELLDEGEGCDGTITIESKCDKSGCPEAWLEEHKEGTYESLSSDGKPNKVTLYYGGEKKGLSVVDSFRSPWEYLSSITHPGDMFDEPAHYAVVVNGCYECGRYVEIDVYPTIEIRFTVGLSYDLISSQRERTIKERRDEQIKSRQAMDNTQPKNKNKLRDGWKYKTAQFELMNKTALNVDFGLKICNVEFTHEYEEEIKKLRRTKALEQLNRADQLVDNLNAYFAPDPESGNKTREYSVFSFNAEPLKIGVSYAYQYTDIKEGPCHYFGLYGKPFLEAKLRFDIIQFICAYCKIDTLVGKCRDYLKRHGTSVECYIEVAPGVNLNIGAAYSKKDDKWAFKILTENQLYLGIKGVVSATFEAEVFVVELRSEAKATIDAAAGFALDEHDNGLDLVLYHDGIKGTFKFSADIGTGDKDSKNTSQPETKNNIEDEWQLSSPLKTEDSPLRVNLYGKERVIPRPAITPPAHFEPWAMGSNPNWNKNDEDKTGYNGISQI